MVQLRPVILALLIALATPAGAITSSAPVVQSYQADGDGVEVYAPEGTAAVLTLGEDAREKRAFTSASLDVGASLAESKQSMDAQFESNSFASQFERAESRDDKRDLLLQYASEIDTRTVELEMRETTARQSFRNGSISANEYLVTLALVDSEARQLQREIELAKDHADEVDGFTLSGYFGSYEKRLVSLQGPVRTDLTATVHGDVSPKQYFFSVADNGVIIAYIQDGTYHREIVRYDHRALEGSDRFSGEAARDRSKELNPWVWEDESGLEWKPNPAGLYDVFALRHSHGELHGVFDRSTGLVFRETQIKYLTDAAAEQHAKDATMPPGPGVTANESGLLLTVNRSYAGGPMYVTLQDNRTGEFAEGEIVVDGEPVGRTTTDGGLWTISPAGTFEVNATSGLTELSVETRSTRPIETYNLSE